MMGALLKLLPPWVPVALGGVLIVALIGGYLGWVHHQREMPRRWPTRRKRTPGYRPTLSSSFNKNSSTAS